MKSMIVLAFIVCSHLLRAQTIEEWTQQKQTRINYLMQQIAANSAYIEVAEKGYQIAANGLQHIRSIKDADLQLHLGFRDSLKIINPVIRQISALADIIAFQTYINKISNRILQEMEANDQFRQAEISYCQALLANLAHRCIKDIDELLLVITSGILEMKDDERIMRIERIYRDMLDKVCFISSFHEEVKILSVQRFAEQSEIDISKKIRSVR